MDPECIACDTISHRSAAFGHWLANENYNDGATLARVLPSRGFCSPHARKLVDADAIAAAYVARWTLHNVGREIITQCSSRNGYRDALRPKEPCHWCMTERNALEAALVDAASQSAPLLCPPHARNLVEWKRNGLVLPRSPQPPCPPLDFPDSTRTFDSEKRWWSPAVEQLWEESRVACTCCTNSRIAGEKRIAFLLAGPLPDEHWDIPTLCVAHDVALGRPRSAAFTKEWHEATECTICAIEHRAQDRTADLALTAFAEEVFREAYAGLTGLCIRHYTTVVEKCTDTGLRTTILRMVRTRIETFVWELEEASEHTAWSFRDQRAGRIDETLPHRAWCFIAGGVMRPFR